MWASCAARAETAAQHTPAAAWPSFLAFEKRQLRISAAGSRTGHDGGGNNNGKARMGSGSGRARDPSSAHAAVSADGLRSQMRQVKNGFAPKRRRSIKQRAKQEEKTVAPPDLLWTTPAVMWSKIRSECEVEARDEPLLSSYLHASILSHDTFEHSLAFILANRLADDTLLSSELFEMFSDVLSTKKHAVEAALADLCAVRQRDPACSSYSQALLYFKGYHAVQAQRIAHELWTEGRRVMALTLQSRMSEVFAADIHPAARFGKGVMLDHGTGVVIGETAVVGNGVSILQNVTLGGTGKETGDRHPKIGDGVLIGASASVLGNIPVGRGAQVAAGSLVLQPVPDCTMVAGSPAKAIGTVPDNPAARMDQWCTDEEAMGAPAWHPDYRQGADSSTGGTGSGHGSSKGGPAAQQLHGGQQQAADRKQVEKGETDPEYFI